MILESFNVNKWKCKVNNILIITSSSYVSFVSQLPSLTIICVTLSGESSYTELLLATVYKNEWVEINIFFNWRKKRWENHCLDPWELKQNELENLQQKLSLWWWHFEISNHIFLELLFMNVNIWKREVNNRINCFWKYGKNDNRSYIKY